MSNCASTDAKILRRRLYEYDKMIREGIRTGTIMATMKKERGDLLDVFNHTRSTDINVRNAFLGFPIVKNFVYSWAKDRKEPGFLKDWQVILARGGTYRPRQSEHSAQAPEEGVDRPAAFTDALSQHRPVAQDADDTSGGNQRLAARNEDRERQPSPRTLKRRVATQPHGQLQHQASPSPGVHVPSRAHSEGTSSPAPSNARTAAVGARPAGLPGTGESAHPPSNITAAPLEAPVTKVEGLRRETLPKRTIRVFDADESSPESGDESAPIQRMRSKRKARAKTVVSDVEMAAPTTAKPQRASHQRRKPCPSGGLHNPPCNKCNKLGQKCQKEIGGGACVACKERKSKCNYSGVKRRRSLPGELVEGFEKELDKGRRKKRKSAREMGTIPDSVPPSDVDRERSRSEDPPQECAQGAEKERTTPNGRAGASRDPSNPPGEVLETPGLATLEPLLIRASNIHSERLDNTLRRMQMMERLVDQISDHLDATLTKAETKITSRLEHLESVADSLSEKLTEVCEFLGLEPQGLAPLGSHPPASQEP